MIGYEFEFLVREGEKPLSKSTFLKFHKILEQQGWQPKYDAGTGELVGSKKDGFYVTTDDSFCIMEINQPPRDTIHECHEQIRQLLAELQSIYKMLGCSIIGTSTFPGLIEIENRHCKDVCVDENCCGKSYIRYINSQRFNAYHHALFYIAANQVWLDLAPDQIVRTLQVFNRLSGVCVALFGNGPIANGKPLDVIEGREKMWHLMLDNSASPYDRKTFGMFEHEYDSVLDYFAFILDMPFYFGLRDGKAFTLADKKKTCRDFFFAKQSDAVLFDGSVFAAVPTIQDFFELQHFTFPNTRLKFFIKDGVKLQTILDAFQNKDEKTFLDCFSKFCLEFRAIGAQQQSELSVGSAFLVGIFQELNAANELLNRKPYTFWVDLCHRSVREGLIETDLIRQFVQLAESGLKKRGLGEEVFLAPLYARLELGKNPGQVLLVRNPWLTLL